jgi:hypothetical protein
MTPDPTLTNKQLFKNLFDVMDDMLTEYEMDWNTVTIKFEPITKTLTLGIWDMSIEDAKYIFTTK